MPPMMADPALGDGHPSAGEPEPEPRVPAFSNRLSHSAVRPDDTTSLGEVAPVVEGFYLERSVGLQVDGQALVAFRREAAVDPVHQDRLESRLHGVALLLGAALDLRDG